jgi:energy-coupling factor transport system ATP-binding protein
MDIILKKVSYTYHPRSPFERKVLHEIDLTLKQGKWIAIVGKTGSGKSTMVQHMNGLVKPTSGSVQIGDVTITSDRKKHPPLYRKVGMVFQYAEHQLFEETVAKDIAYGPRNLEWPEEMIQKRVKTAMHQVGLDVYLMERSPFELSGGQKRRVAIAGVLAMQPEVLILDEPTAGLDPAGKEKIMHLIEEWQKEEQRTVIVITHQMDHVAEYADEVIVLAEGRVQWHTDPLKLFTTYRRELEDMGLGIPESMQLVEELNKKLASPIQLQSIKKKDIFRQIAEHMKRRDISR